jgi:hypothetical protein
MHVLSTHANLRLINLSFQSKEKKRILEEYVSKFGSGYQESIITRKKGRHNHNEPLQSLASFWQGMKPSTDKYY